MLCCLLCVCVIMIVLILIIDIYIYMYTHICVCMYCCEQEHRCLALRCITARSARCPRCGESRQELITGCCITTLPTSISILIRRTHCDLSFSNRVGTRAILRIATRSIRIQGLVHHNVTKAHRRRPLRALLQPVHRQPSQRSESPNPKALQTVIRHRLNGYLA